LGPGADDNALRPLFPNGKSAPPATERQIIAVESALEVQCPEQLRAPYPEWDGFREKCGNAKYRLSLTDDDFIGSLVTLTRFHWTELKEYWPRLDSRPYIFIGSSSGDNMWGINWKGPQQIIAFHHHLEGKLELQDQASLKSVKRITPLD
jgi:hypothetical protein